MEKNHINWEWLEGIPYLVPTAVWGPGEEREQGMVRGCRPSPGHPHLGDSRGPGPTSTGPWLLDDVFDQPVDPLVESQAPQERDLPGRRVVGGASG